MTRMSVSPKSEEKEKGKFSVETYFLFFFSYILREEVD